MKKWLSMILVLALAVCAVVIPASAEDNSGTDAVSSASVNTNGGKTQRNNPNGYEG